MGGENQRRPVAFDEPVACEVSRIDGDADEGLQKTLVGGACSEEYDRSDPRCVELLSRGGEEGEKGHVSRHVARDGARVILRTRALVRSCAAARDEPHTRASVFACAITLEPIHAGALFHVRRSAVSNQLRERDVFHLRAGTPLTAGG